MDELEKVFIRNQFQIEKLKNEKLFVKLNQSEYMAMEALREALDRREGDGAIYLYEIAENLNLPMPTVSKIVQRLNEKGLISWELDIETRKNTYIKMTENGNQLLEEQKTLLHEFYHNVIGKLGEEYSEKFVSMLAHVNEIMKTEMANIENA